MTQSPMHLTLCLISAPNILVWERCEDSGAEALAKVETAESLTQEEEAAGL